MAENYECTKGDEAKMLRQKKQCQDLGQQVIPGVGTRGNTGNVPNRRGLDDSSEPDQTLFVSLSPHLV